MPFEVSVGGQSWRTDDLTMAEACDIQKTTGKGWLHINPITDAEDCRAVIVAFLSRSLGADGAQEKVDAMSIKEALDAVTVVSDDLPDVYEAGLPKAEAAPSTATSSGPPDDSGGPRT